MTSYSWSGRWARRPSAVGASVLMTLGGLVAAAPTAPAATSATSAGRAVSVAAGTFFTCAVTTVGGVECWGYNSDGQLGDGTTTTRRRPVAVTGLTSGVAQVSAGHSTACALTTTGGVKCWGDGSTGQLGNGSTASSSTPVDVVGLTSGVRSISIGSFSACALTTAGAVKCWGSGWSGQLGNGTTEGSTTPVDVIGLGAGVRAVSTGATHACALTAGGISCWGDNLEGELGIGPRTVRQTTPVAVARLGVDVASVSAGYLSTCAVTGQGRSYCWGYNGVGYLGVGSDARYVRVPHLVTGLHRTLSVVNGEYVTCALGAHQTSCWGANGYGAVGDGTTTVRTSPVPVVGLPAGPVTSVSSAGSHTCAVASAGRVLCWGYNPFGQLGDGTTTDSFTPVAVAGLGA